MKKIILILLLLNAYIAKGQKIAYSDVYKKITTSPKDTAILILAKYISNTTDPNCNAYIQISLLSFQRIKELKPITQNINKIKIYLTYGRKYFPLSLNILKNKKLCVKKNKKYFKNIPELSKIKKLNNEVVINYMEIKYKNFRIYSERLQKVIENFNYFKLHYSIADSLYIILTQKYPVYTNLILAPRETTKPILQKLISEFDSCLYFFEFYKINYSNITNGKTPTLKLLHIQKYPEKIHTIRFCSDTISILDYKEWAKKITSKLDNEIANMKQLIEEKYILLKTLQKYADTLNSIPIINLNPLITQINKTDPNSVIIPLLKFELIKAQLLYFTEKLKNYNYLQEGIQYFLIVKQKYDTAQNYLILTAQKITPINYKKYQKFFAKFYGSYTNLQHYPKEQKAIIISLYDTLKTTIKQLYENYIKNDTNPCAKELKIIQNYNTAVSNMPNGKYIVKIIHNKQQRFLCGYEKKSSLYTEPFIAVEIDSSCNFIYPGLKNYHFVYCQKYRLGITALLKKTTNYIIITGNNEFSQILNFNFDKNIIYFYQDTNKKSFYFITRSNQDSSLLSLYEYQDTLTKTGNVKIEGEIKHIEFIDNSYFIFTNAQTEKFQDKIYSGLMAIVVNRHGKISKIYPISRLYSCGKIFSTEKTIIIPLLSDNKLIEIAFIQTDKKQIYFEKFK